VKFSQDIVHQKLWKSRSSYYRVIQNIEEGFFGTQCSVILPVSQLQALWLV